MRIRNHSPIEKRSRKGNIERERPELKRKKKNPSFITNPIFEDLASRENISAKDIREFSERIDSVEFLYGLLERSGFYLPSKRSFNLDWAQAWLRGEREFLLCSEIIDFCPRTLPSIGIDFLLKKMRSERLSKYFYFSNIKKPNFQYIYRVLATLDEEFDGLMRKTNQYDDGRVFVARDRWQFITNNTAPKKPRSKRYRGFIVPHLVSKPENIEQLEEFEEIAGKVYSADKLKRVSAGIIGEMYNRDKERFDKTKELIMERRVENEHLFDLFPNSDDLSFNFTKRGKKKACISIPSSSSNHSSQIPSQSQRPNLRSQNPDVILIN